MSASEDIERVLGADSLATIAAKSILEGITPEHRDELIQGAVASLLEPGEAKLYGTKRVSPIEAAFRSQTELVLQRMIYDQLLSDGRLKEELDKCFTRALELAFGDDEKKETLAEKMAKAIRCTMLGDRW